MALVSNYRDLEIWKLGMAVAKAIYQITGGFPKSEQYGLTSQMRRAAVSIPSNIAEGFGRHGRKDMCHFLVIAQGSIAELETQITLAQNLGFITSDQHDNTLEQLDHLGRMITRFTQRL